MLHRQVTYHHGLMINNVYTVRKVTLTIYLQKYDIIMLSSGGHDCEKCTYCMVEGKE